LTPVNIHDAVDIERGLMEFASVSNGVPATPRETGAAGAD